MNEYLEAIGTGAFHAGVEVNGVEYSYGYAPDRTGVFTCAPKGCKAHVYKDSLDMGATSKSASEIDEIIEEMKEPSIETTNLLHTVVFCHPWISVHV